MRHPVHSCGSDVVCYFRGKQRAEHGGIFHPSSWRHRQADLWVPEVSSFYTVSPRTAATIHRNHVSIKAIRMLVAEKAQLLLVDRKRKLHSSRLKDECWQMSLTYCIKRPQHGKTIHCYQYSTLLLYPIAHHSFSSYILDTLPLAIPVNEKGMYNNTHYTD